MLHNDTAQQRPGEKPASAPKTSQKSPRAQAQAKFKIPTLKRADSRHEDIDASGLRDRNRETRYIIHIHGRHSPPTRLQLTTPATTPQSPTIFLYHKPMLLPQPARNHSFGKDTCTPARSSDLSLVRNNNSLCMAWHAQQICGQGHSASTTSVAAGGVAMQVQYKQGQTVKERQGLPKHNSLLRSMAPIC